MRYERRAVPATSAVLCMIAVVWNGGAVSAEVLKSEDHTVMADHIDGRKMSVPAKYVGTVNVSVQPMGIGKDARCQWMVEAYVERQTCPSARGCGDDVPPNLRISTSFPTQGGTFKGNAGGADPCQGAALHYQKALEEARSVVQAEFAGLVKRDRTPPSDRRAEIFGAP